MNINNIIRKLMDEQNVSFATMAARDYKKDGKPKQAKDVAATLCQNKSMAIKTILPYLDSLGYELVVQKKTRGNRREDCIVVTYDVNEPNYKKGDYVEDLSVFPYYRFLVKNGTLSEKQACDELHINEAVWNRHTKKE